MNDFDYDVLQKKRIARGAIRMKGGSKSKKCTLPSDHLTPAQWKRRNGPVNTYSLNQPMDWETFKSIPIDIQQSYIDILQRRFNVTAATISKELFGNTASVLRLHMNKHGIKYTPMKGRNMSADERDLWERWLSPVAPEWAPAEEDPAKVQQYLDELALPEDYDAETEERMDDEPMEDPDVAEVLEGFKAWYESLPTTKPLSLDELTAVFTGVFSPENFLDWVSRLPIPYDNVRIKVEVTRE
jgi:hypothetical protein